MNDEGNYQVVRLEEQAHMRQIAEVVRKLNLNDADACFEAVAEVQGILDPSKF